MVEHEPLQRSRGGRPVPRTSAESDTKRRKALYASLQERLAREHVALWLCTIPYATIRNRNLLHVADQPFGILSPLDEARWKRP